MPVFGHLILCHCSLIFFQLIFFLYLILDSFYCHVFNLIFLLQYLTCLNPIQYVLHVLHGSIPLWKLDLVFLSMFYVSKLFVHTEYSHPVPILMSLFPNFNICVSSGLVFVDHSLLFLIGCLTWWIFTFLGTGWHCGILSL